MNHLALFIGAPGQDGTPLDMARECVRAFEKRMETLFVLSTHDHQGHPIHIDESRVPCAGPYVYVSGARESDHRNGALAYVRATRPNVDRVWCVDTDEAFFDKDFEALKRRIENGRNEAAWYVPRYAYWKGVNWRIEKAEPTPALICLDPRKVPAFVWGRECVIDQPRFPTAKYVKIEDVYQHHLTAVRTDEEMEQKWKVFHHSGEDRPEWFEKVWRGWEPNMTALHPTHPNCWNRAIKVSIDDVPEAIRPYFEKWSWPRP